MQRTVREHGFKLIFGDVTRRSDFVGISGKVHVCLDEENVVD